MEPQTTRSTDFPPDFPLKKPPLPLIYLEQNVWIWSSTSRSIGAFGRVRAYIHTYTHTYTHTRCSKGIQGKLCTRIRVLDASEQYELSLENRGASFFSTIDFLLRIFATPLVVPRGSCSRRITKLIAARLGDELQFLESRKKSEGKFPRQIFLYFLRTKQIRTRGFFFRNFLIELKRRQSTPLPRRLG